jgi:glutathione peroxidase
MKNQKSFYEFEVKNAQGQNIKLSEYKEQVILVVNVASKCGFTPQYKGLESLDREYKNQGFVILGFPCNQFGAQEPGNESEILEFCSLNYDVTFPIMHKIDVNGDNANPLYAWLKSQATGILGTEAIKWNFTKFLIGKEGQVIERFAPQDKPEDLRGKIQSAIASR